MKPIVLALVILCASTAQAQYFVPGPAYGDWSGRNYVVPVMPTYTYYYGGALGPLGTPITAPSYYRSGSYASWRNGRLQGFGSYFTGPGYVDYGGMSRGRYSWGSVYAD